MTIEEKMKNTNTEEFAKELLEFASGFYAESIDGLCVIECDKSPNSCIGCITNWLKQNTISNQNDI